MAFAFILIYFLLLLSQATVWIPAFQNKPLSEICILLSIIFSLLGDGGSNIKFAFKLPQTRLFIFFIIWSVFSIYYMGLTYAFGVIGYKYFKYLATFLAIIAAVDSIKKIRFLLFFLIILGSLLAINSIFQYHNGTDIAGQTLNWRGSVQWIGFFDGSNGFCLLMVVLFSYALNFFFLKEYNTFFVRVVSFVFASLIFWSIILSGSRGGFLAFICVLLVSIYFKYCDKIKLKTFIPLAIALSIVFIVLKPSEEGRGYGESSSPERIELFHQGLQMIKRSPIIGIGADEFWRNNPVRKQAHNIWLQHMSETGFVGGTIFVMMFFEMFLRLWHSINNSRDDPLKYSTATLIFSGIVGFFAAAFFLTVVYEMPYIMLAFGSLFPFFDSDNNYKTTRNTLVFVPVVNFLLLLTIYFLIQLFFIIYR